MPMHEALHLRDEINRLYVSRKEGGRIISSIENCIDVSIQGLENYIKKSNERLITAAHNGISNIRPDRKMTKTRKQKWEEKHIYGYFKRPTGKITQEKTWTILWKVKIQEWNWIFSNSSTNNVIKTNYIKIKTDNAQQNNKCRLCGEKVEMVNRILSGCSKIAQKIQNQAWLDEKGDPLRIVQEIEILQYCQMVYALTRIHLR